MIKAKNRKNKNTDLSLEYLKTLWESQNGICPYTGHKMILPGNTNHPKKFPTKASLDRIDSSKGYIVGNVEFVCLSVNYAKNSFTKREILEFFTLSKV